ncbi:GNAT family protein [Babesia ovata]|uniref:GNAT family protein n=1 Tax=Babesia ovata TaxID=189622 RepID=A0A2H6K765_9APIC|nr:GNAT family protein [Babesia ovata]GBE58847.1 GNAT family protein [Babesia ovata]
MRRSPQNCSHGLLVVADCLDGKKRYKCLPYESSEIQCMDAAFATYPVGFSCFTSCGELKCPSDDFMTPSVSDDFKVGAHHGKCVIELSLPIPSAPGCPCCRHDAADVQRDVVTIRAPFPQKSIQRAPSNSDTSSVIAQRKSGFPSVAYTRCSRRVLTKMNFAICFSAFVALFSTLFAAVPAASAAAEFNKACLKEFMVLKNNDRFVARRYGTFSLPDVLPRKQEAEPASERRMTFSDIHAIRRIEKDRFTELYGFAEYLMFLVYYPNLCFVIDIDGELAAFIIGKTEIEDGVTYGHVTSLVVRPAFRRQKFATRLMQEFERVCREELNCAFINFFVNPENEGALSLYNKLGYRVHRRLPKYYNSENDAFDMRKPITVESSEIKLSALRRLLRELDYYRAELNTLRSELAKTEESSEQKRWNMLISENVAVMHATRDKMAEYSRDLAEMGVETPADVLAAINSDI